LLVEESNKQSHLKRLQDNIAAKMSDTQALNRECDKATVSFAEQEHSQQGMMERLMASSASVEQIQTRKHEAEEALARAEELLQEEREAVGVSEEKLAERIAASKASISSFFVLKKEANTKEWELSKVKTGLQQRIEAQQEVLASLESENLLMAVQEGAEKQEVSNSGGS
jgi:hypothetical protein